MAKIISLAIMIIHCIGLKIWHNIRLLLKYATQNNIDVSFQLHIGFYRLILEESKVPDF